MNIVCAWQEHVFAVPASSGPTTLLPSPRQADNFFFFLSPLLVETGAWGEGGGGGG
jgi:hypothetical protein